MDVYLSLKLGVVVILMIISEKNILNYKFKSKQFIPYDDYICKFVNDLSKKLLLKFDPRDNADIATLAFFCRNGNILKLKKDFYAKKKIKKPLGVIFHVPPNNIATNFAYSFIFSLLLGNSNIIRISNKLLDHSGKLVKIINNLMKEKYKKLYENNFFVFYEKSNEINLKLNSICDGRMIWGGNKTVKFFKNIITQPHVKDIFFYDRYSICVIQSEILNKSSNNQLKLLAKNFFNDTYLVDQAACSSPILINWLGKNIEVAKKKFWAAMYSHLKQIKYDKLFSDYSAIDKEVVSSTFFADKNSYVKNYKNLSNMINIIELKKVPKDINFYKGKFGLFFEYNLKNLSDIRKFINRGCQTLTYFGLNKNELIRLAENKNLYGIDRFVNIGSSLDMNIIWDGVDLNEALTRNITIT